jgi:hypothetical protein
MRISMALAYEHFSFNIRMNLCNQMITDGWHVVVSNAPHDPWFKNVFLWASISREHPQTIIGDNAIEANWEQIVDFASKESALADKRAEAISANIHQKKKKWWRR